MKKKFINYTSGLLAVLVGMGIFAQLPSSAEVLHAEASTNTDNLKVDKTSTYNKEDNSYTISLHAYTTGDVDVITKSKPTDIVLVLDQSGSMRDQMKYDINYYPVYADGQDSEIIDSKTYYFKESNDSEYRIVTRTQEFEYGPGFKPIYSWKDSDGNLYYPLNKDGSVVSNKYPSLQFYRISKIPVGPTKLDSLKTAAKSFISNVEKDGGDHRIAVVGFGTGDQKAFEYDILYHNTELFIGSSTYNISDSAINNKYGVAYQSIQDANDLNRLNRSIDALKANGSTRADLGMVMAENIVDAYPTDPNRNKIVIMFTDGVPTNVSEFETKVANDTITASKRLKEKGAMVFTVGVVDTLDNTQNPGVSSTNDLNRYMQYVSSNYPNATSMANGNTGDYLAGKFLAATDEESLKEMFSKINEEISSTTSTLNEKTILKDYISDYFTLEGNKDVKVYTQNYLGNNKWGEKEAFQNAEVNFNSNDKTVSVNGFNYKENYIVDGQNPKGKRLVVDLKVKAKDGFIGGNNVVTNKEESGIYDNDTMIKEFPMPSVDVAIDYQGSAKDASMYLTQTIQNPELIIDADSTKAGIQFQNSKGTATLDGINNKYVDISYSIKNEKGETIGKAILKAGTTTLEWLENLSTAAYDKDTVINVETKVTPVSEACGEGVEAKEVSDIQTSTIYVFKPQVTLENKTIFLGEKLNLKDAVTMVEWKASQQNIMKPTGTAPNLTYNYKVDTTMITNAESYAAKNDSEVSVNVIANAKDITKDTQLVNANKPSHGDYFIQVVKGELEITKKANAAYSENGELKSNQTFIFKIEVRDPVNNTVLHTYYESIDFDAKDFVKGTAEKSITLKGLEKGMYTITEESNWSWKYLLKNSVTNYKNMENTLYIGEKNDASAKFPYFGIEKDTKIQNVLVENPGSIELTNERNEMFNVLGDCANAINQFIG